MIRFPKLFLCVLRELCVKVLEDSHAKLAEDAKEEILGFSTEYRHRNSTENQS